MQKHISSYDNAIPAIYIHVLWRRLLVTYLVLVLVLVQSTKIHKF